MIHRDSNGEGYGMKIVSQFMRFRCRIFGHYYTYEKRTQLIKLGEGLEIAIDLINGKPGRDS